MADNSYPLEIRLASKNGWFTPAESNGYYATKYARNGVTVHWWGDGTGASNHDNIVNYMLNQSQQGLKSVNYVLSDNKITMLVNPDNVAWASQGGNPTTVSVEFQPTLGAEGYKKGGWLIDQLEQRYGHGLTLYPHSHWFQTACPGTISLERLRGEANKWKSGFYNPKPVPTPTPTPTPPPPAVEIKWTRWAEGAIKYVINKDTHLWNFNSNSWQMTSIKPLKKGEMFEAVGQATNTKLNATYYLTEYSFSKGITNGVNPADLDLYVPPVKVPSTPPEPTPDPLPPVGQEPVPPTLDERVSVLERLVQYITDFLSGIFTNFKKG